MTRTRIRKAFVLVATAVLIQFGAAPPASASPTCYTPGGVDPTCTCSLSGHCHTAFGDFACEGFTGDVWC